MRCPHCDGEIHDGSRFCGICGRQLVAANAPASPQQPTPARAPAPSAGQARAAAEATAAPTNHAAKRPRPAQAAQPGPPAASAGRARVVTMMALNLVLLSAGGWMIGSFVDDCRGAQRDLAAPGASAPSERGDDKRGDDSANRPSVEAEGGATAEPPQ